MWYQQLAPELPHPHPALFGLTLDKNYLGVEWGSESDTVFDTKLCFNLSSWLPGISVCKSSTSLGLIFIICKKRADAELDNVQDLSQLCFLALVYWTSSFFFFLFLSQDVGWLQLLVSVDLASLG